MPACRWCAVARRWWSWWPTPRTPPWIQFICLVTDAGYQIKPLTPADAPHAEFAVPAGETPVKVYEHCNLHGLWVAEL